MAPELADRPRHRDADAAALVREDGVERPWSAYREPAGGYPVALRSGRMVADRDLLDGPDGGLWRAASRLVRRLGRGFFPEGYDRSDALCDAVEALLAEAAQLGSGVEPWPIGRLVLAVQQRAELWQWGRPWSVTRAAPSRAWRVPWSPATLLAGEVA